MPSASYSFLDVAALEGVRERFARGDALAVLSSNLGEVIWANGPGAALFGYADVEAAIGAPTTLGLAARRQISATRGFPAIGQNRPVQARMTTGMTSRMVAFEASSLRLPDGELAILLAVPAATGGARSSRDVAEHAIGGFAEAGHFVAFINDRGEIEAASAGFDALGLTRQTLAAMVARVAGEPDRVVKQMIQGGRCLLPAGMARLTDSRHLLVVIDEGTEDEVAVADGPAEAARQDDRTPASDATPAPDAGTSRAAIGEQTGAAAEDQTASPQKPEPTGAADAGHEIWYFNENVTGDEKPPDNAGDNRPGTVAPVAEAAGEEAPAAHEEEADPDTARSATERQAAPDPSKGPVRFVWRTDADGKFSQISPEFAHAVGGAAADIVGRDFEDVAHALGFDPKGDIAGLLARRDTWSGRSVLWPLAGTDLHIPVDLAALPVYGRDRVFEGFRGFGVARTGDAAVDPRGIGLTLGETAAATAEIAAPAEDKSPDKTDDPLRGQVPALTIVPTPTRRFSDKVVRLAEHRPAADNDKGLSSGERMAFQQIGERLKKDSGAAADRNDATDAAEAPESTAATTEAGDEAAAEATEAATQEDVAIFDPSGEPVDDGSDIADLERIDGAAPAPQDDAVAAEPADMPAPGRKPARPGMSLLDFARWESDAAGTSAAARADAELTDAEEPRLAGSGESDGAPEDGETPATAENEQAWQAASTAKMDSAADLDEWTPEPRNIATESGPVAKDGDQTQGGRELSGAPLDAAAADDAERADDQPAMAHKPASSAGLSILEKLPVPVLVHSGDTLHYANDEFAALTGYRSIEELAQAGGIGVLFADNYEDEDAPEKVDRQLRLKTRDGEEIPVEAFLQSAPWDGGKALMLVLSRAREGGLEAGRSPLVAELEARVAEMRTIIDTATDGVVLISRDGTIRSISRPAEALFAFESDEVAGKPFTSLFAIESQRAARDYLAGLSENGVASVLNDGREVIGREAEGRFIPLFMTIGRLPHDSGYCAVVRDITQWKRAEEDLTQARAVAERASSQKTDFLARVSHEIRTPLNAIIGFSELMMDEKFGPVANDRYRDYLRDINRSGNHVLDLVNDLLDISKIEAGQQEMSYEAVSLNDALAETVAMMQPQANRERVIIRSSFASNLPEVVADLRSVRQIALNLLSNAVRYTQAGGQVIVSTAYETAGDVVMRVRDTGIGMSQPEIEQALKPFKQINSLKRPRGDGTGLGLPLTKAMVEANRAKFTINSTPGEGTLVEISFPSTRVLAD